VTVGLRSNWEAQCFACGEVGLVVTLMGEHDDLDRIGLQCPTCMRPGVIAYQRRDWRKKKKQRGKIW